MPMRPTKLLKVFYLLVHTQGCVYLQVTLAKIYSRVSTSFPGSLLFVMRREPGNEVASVSGFSQGRPEA